MLEECKICPQRVGCEFAPDTPNCKARRNYMQDSSKDVTSKIRFDTFGSEVTEEFKVEAKGPLGSGEPPNHLLHIETTPSAGVGATPPKHTFKSISPIGKHPPILGIYTLKYGPEGSDPSPDKPAGMVNTGERILIIEDSHYQYGTGKDFRPRVLEEELPLEIFNWALRIADISISENSLIKVLKIVNLLQTNPKATLKDITKLL